MGSNSHAPQLHFGPPASLPFALHRQEDDDSDVVMPLTPTRTTLARSPTQLMENLNGNNGSKAKYRRSSTTAAPYEMSTSAGGVPALPASPVAVRAKTAVIQEQNENEPDNSDVPFEEIAMLLAGSRLSSAGVGEQVKVRSRLSSSCVVFIGRCQAGLYRWSSVSAVAP